MSILCIAEKPSLAESISKIISNNDMTTKKMTTPVHSFRAKFRNKIFNFKFSSVTGHVYSLDFTKGHSWDKVDPYSLFTAPTVKVPVNISITKHLQSLAKGIDILMLWLDCDKEGENICFEVIENCKSNLNKNYEILRARFSSLCSNDILAALSNLGKPNICESLSVDVRQELDLRMGVAFTRFQTKFFQGKYGNLNSDLISYGPCQTPTLGFCVKRGDEISTFKSEKYWSINVYLDNEYNNISLEWDRGRIFDNNICSLYHNIISDNSDKAFVTSFTTSQKKRSRPLPLNTVELLKIASQSLNIGPTSAMHAAESLYTSGLISYPRTETKAYAPNFNTNALVSMLASGGDDNSISNAARSVLKLGIINAKRGEDAGDHPPITPVKLVNYDLSGDQGRIYDYVCRHFLASISHDAVYSHSSVTIAIGSESFAASGKNLISPGFLTSFPWMLRDHEKNIPNFKKNDKINISSIKKIEGQTSPPGYLTERELIEMMDNHGIGTDASIPTHINNIVTRNYVRLGPNRTLIPNDLGIVLCHGYYRIDSQLVVPTVRSEVERQLNLIAKGEVDSKKILKYAIDTFKRKYIYFVRNIEKMDSLFENNFVSIENTIGKILSKCGICSRWMKFIQLKPSRLHCGQCDKSYSLPQNGSIKLYMEKKCPLDGFELLKFSAGQKGKSYHFCPFCYNYPPFKGFNKGMACVNCINPTCKQSLVVFGVVNCPECPGMLVFDPVSGPNWKISCNQCGYIVSFANKAHKVSLLNQYCTKCTQCKLFDIDFHKDSTPLSDNSTKHIGCLLCDPILSSTTNSTYGSFNKFKSRGRGRGRGRGRHSKKIIKKNVDPLMTFDGF